MKWFRPVKPKIVGWNLEVCELFGFKILLNASLLLLVITPFANLYIFYLLPAILIHELAHAVVGRYVGYRNGNIIVWILGGLYYSDDFTINLLKLASETDRFGKLSKQKEAEDQSASLIKLLEYF